MNAEACSCRQCSQSTKLVGTRSSWGGGAWEAEDDEADDAWEAEDDENDDEALKDDEDDEADDAWEAEDDEDNEDDEDDEDDEDHGADDAWEAEDDDEALEEDEVEDRCGASDPAWSTFDAAVTPKFIKVASFRNSIAWTSADKDKVNVAMVIATHMVQVARATINRVIDGGRKKKGIRRRRKLWRQLWADSGAQKWFGKWTRVRMMLVRRNIKQLARRLDRRLKFIRWDKDTFGRTVGGNLTSRIWLGNTFFEFADFSGTCNGVSATLRADDCRATTIIHEALHKVLPYLGRLEVQAADALAIARSKPRRAVKNVGNYEGFIFRAFIDTTFAGRNLAFRSCLESLVVRQCLA